MILRAARYLKRNIIAYRKDIHVKKSLKQWQIKQYDSNRKIKVGFILQMPEVWDKESPVYDLMKQQEQFETYLIVVPSYDFNQEKLNAYGEERAFIYEKYPNDNMIEALDSDGKVIDIKKYAFDYVFYQRPYDYYLPTELRSETLVTYTKVCYIPYAYQGATVFTGGNTNKDFFRNVYMAFLDSEEMRDNLIAVFKKNHREKLQKFLYVGYPVFDTYLNMKETNDSNGILWTPRWSFDPKLGGSHFVDYKDSFLALRRNYPKNRIILRPHPLMFENVIKEGLMTSDEVCAYQQLLEDNNIMLDSNKIMDETVKDSKVLITDFSSIIITYFMTGKPIIYCPFETELNELYTNLMQGIYIANSWEEVDKYLAMIDSGEDVLYNTRRKIIDAKLKHLGGGSKNVIEAIINDFTQ